jgi:hypothetical protein
MNLKVTSATFMTSTAMMLRHIICWPSLKNIKSDLTLYNTYSKRNATEAKRKLLEKGKWSRFISTEPSGYVTLAYGSVA